MDNQKFFLIIAIGLSIFLLWDRWQATHDEHGNPIVVVQPVAQQSAVAAETSGADVPRVVNNNTSDLPGAQANQSAQPFVTVSTDTLDLQISLKGGTVQSAHLNQYPISLGSEDKFQLLSNKPGELFQAQSGLLPQNVMPTHHSTYTSAQNNYVMTGDTLTVPLTYQSGGVSVTKNFHFERDSYVVTVDYQVANQTNNNINVSSYTQLARNAIDESSLMMPTFSGGARFDDEEVFEKLDFDEFDTNLDSKSQGGWWAMVQHYFLAAWIPDANETHTYSSKSSNGKYLLTTVNPANTIAPGASATLKANRLYVGPKEQARIDVVAPGLDKTVDYGVLFIIAKPLAELLHWIHSWVNSWGYAIIILTILIKLAFYKLSEKSYRSMAGMRKLAPRLEQIKEAYGDDKQKMGVKTMELYKKEGVNPASGCLPILVQIPVFISLYWVLLEMVELRQTPFWYLADLSAEDPYFILPIIMGLSMIVQQKLNPTPPDPMQAKIMMSLPFVFTLFFLWFPSGLVLYWVVNNVLSIAQQWVINKRING